MTKEPIFVVVVGVEGEQKERRLIITHIFKDNPFLLYFSVFFSAASVTK